MNDPSPLMRENPVKKPHAAFSLVELLTVVAVMSLLLSFVVPAVSSLARGSRLNQSLVEIAGTIDQARQYAIAQNTYVWVAMRPDPEATDGDALSVVVLASKTGIDPSPWSNYGTVPNARIDLISRPRTFSQIRFEDAATFGSDQIPDLADKPSVASTNSPSSGTAVFSVRLPGEGANVNFERVIQFTPAGEARVASSMIDIIEFGLHPSRGGEDNVAVVRIQGLTGRTAVHRP